MEFLAGSQKKFNSYRKVYDRQPARTKILIGLLFLAFCFSLLINFVYRPQQRLLADYRQEIVSLKNRQLDLKARIPDVESQRKLLERERNALNVLTDELKNLEAELPQQDSLPTLLGELIRQTRGDLVEFRSIKPMEVGEKEAYDRMNIEMQLTADFSGLLNYSRRLETIFPFMTINEVAMQESSQERFSRLDIKLVVSTLLNDKTTGGGIRELKKDLAFEAVIFENNPFVSSVFQKTSLAEDQDYQISGIIYQGQTPTVIINDEVFTVGDYLDGYQVEKIMRNSVILSDGFSAFELKMEENP